VLSGIRPIGVIGSLGNQLLGNMIFNWLHEYWHIVWGMIAGVLYLAYRKRADKHLENKFGSHWKRIKYSVVAAIPIGAILMLCNIGLEIFAPEYSLFDYFFSPYFLIFLFILSWLLAPYMSKYFTINNRS